MIFLSALDTLSLYKSPFCRKVAVALFPPFLRARSVPHIQIHCKGRTVIEDIGTDAITGIMPLPILRGQFSLQGRFIRLFIVVQHYIDGSTPYIVLRRSTVHDLDIGHPRRRHRLKGTDNLRIREGGWFPVDQDGISGRSGFAVRIPPDR